MIGEHDANAIGAQQGNEVRLHEAWMPHFDDMEQAPPIDLCRQQLEECFEVRQVELLGGWHLPVDRAEFFPELQHTAGQEALDGCAGFGQYTAMRGEARRLK